MKDGISATSATTLRELKELFKEPLADDQTMDFSMSPDWNNGYRAAVNECRPSMLALIRNLESPSNQWVSADDRHPEEPGTYIVAWLNGEVSAYEMDEFGGFVEVDEAIAYWMPLPEPPL